MSRDKKEDPQDKQKRLIKCYLKMNALDYEWLAEKALSTVTTVRNWMSTKPIPEAKMKHIMSLIGGSSAAPEAKPAAHQELQTGGNETYRLALPRDLIEVLRSAAAADSVTLEEYVNATMAAKAVELRLSQQRQA